MFSILSTYPFSFLAVPQRRRRLIQLLLKTALEQPSEKDATRWQVASKEWLLKFLRSPKEILAEEESNKVRGINFTINKLVVGTLLCLKKFILNISYLKFYDGYYAIY